VISSRPFMLGSQRCQRVAWHVLRSRNQTFLMSPNQTLLKSSNTQFCVNYDYVKLCVHDPPRDPGNQSSLPTGVASENGK
jgi:hypothetical protein